MESKLAIISLWAEDIGAATRFYCDVMGLRLLFQHSGRPHFDLNGTYLVILKGKPQPVLDAVPERFPILAFQVPNLEEALKTLDQHQVEQPWGIEEDAGYCFVMFRDPAGNLLELVQYKVP